MKQAKRLLALLLALVLCMALLPAALAEDAGTIAPAEEPAEEPGEGTIAPAPDEPQEVYSGSCGDDLTWSFDSDSGKLTISGTGDMTDFTVSTVPWGEYQDQILSLEIGEGVTGIGDYAFEQCEFSEVTIPDSVTRIGGGAFANCLRLESVTIPAGVTSIGKQAFYNCLWLSAFFVDEASASYSAADGILFNKDGTTLIVAPLAHEYSHYAIPAGVERIEDFAFANCGDLYSLEFPVSLTEIGQSAFWHCSNLMSVCFPQNLSAIGDLAFWHCAAMTEIRFLGHAPTFGTQPFRNVGANAYYPAADETWTEEVRQNYGGTLTWLPFDFYLPDGYYLIGPDGWEVVNVDPNEKFVLNIAIAEYVLTTTLTAGDPVKVVEVEDSAITTWYPDGLGNEYVVDAAHAGTVNIYFKPTYNREWKEFGGHIWIEAVEQPLVNPFTDVAEGKYYYAPVLWAISQDPPITSGTGEGTFSPNQTCTRAQIVTFIWNAFGQPEPSGTNNPFADVPEGKWYTKAVLWAVEKGITSGVDARHFGPNQQCTRAQVVTFLWNAYGKPEPTNTVNPFKDVKEGKWYTKAVLWAVEMGITSGMSADTFGTDRTCTRGQVVTFLYNTKDIPKP